MHGSWRIGDCIHWGPYSKIPEYDNLVVGTPIKTPIFWKPHISSGISLPKGRRIPITATDSVHVSSKLQVPVWDRRIYEGFTYFTYFEACKEVLTTCVACMRLAWRHGHYVLTLYLSFCPGSSKVFPIKKSSFPNAHALQP